MQGQQHQLAVDIIAVQPRRGPPDDGAALGGGQVLHGVEAEAGKVSRFAAAQAAAASAEAVRRVGKHDRPAVERLQIVGGTEAPGGAPHRFKNAVVVAHAAAHVDRNHGLGALVDIPVQLVIVHLQAAGRNVRKDNFRADMRGDGGRRGIGVGAGDHFVARAHAEQAQGELKCGGRRVEAGRARRAGIVPDALFQPLRLRPGRNPAAAQRLRDGLYFRLGNIGRRKGYLSHNLLLCARCARRQKLFPR